uniref:Ero1-like protein n=1 Tax=Culex pipiens TaxID=7175 RepID=A0A8D8MBB4_CULPI
MGTCLFILSVVGQLRMTRLQQQMNEATMVSVSMASRRTRHSGELSKLQWLAVGVVAFLSIVNLSCGYFYSENPEPGSDRFCFCQLQGTIDDCSCNVDTVDYYNNVKIYPRLRSILVKDFFRYYKVNLAKECPFWVDDSKCAMRFCHVEHCEEKDIPPGLKGDVSSYQKVLHTRLKVIRVVVRFKWRAEVTYLSVIIGVA